MWMVRPRAGRRAESRAASHSDGGTVLRPPGQPKRALAELRAVLLCGVGTGNVGNDASLATAVDLIRAERPRADFRVATPFPDGARNLLDLPVLPMRQNMTQYLNLGSRGAIVKAIALGEVRRLREAAILVRSADLLVVTGTGIFDDFGENPWNMPYALLSWTGLARLYRRPFAFLAVGAGPVVNPVSRLLFVVAARLATLVSYRDEGSLQFMKGIGAEREDARVCPDLVFGMERPAARAANPSAQRLVVGVGVMLYGGWSAEGEGPIYEKYVECLVDVVDRLVGQGHAVRFLVGQPCDLPVVEEVIRRSRPALRTSLRLPSIVDLRGLLEAVGETDLVIATRYHNVVAALMMNRPVVSLSYAPKNADLLATAEVFGFDRPIEQATADWVLERVEQIRGGRSGFSEPAWRIVGGWGDAVRAEVRRVLARAAAEQS